MLCVWFLWNLLLQSLPFLCRLHLLGKILHFQTVHLSECSAHCQKLLLLPHLSYFSEVCAVVDVSAAFSFPHPANAVSSIAVVINAAIIFSFFCLLILIIFHMDFPCDHSHPAGISISSCLFRCEFYYVFSLCKSMLQTEILQKYLVITSVDVVF